MDMLRKRTQRSCALTPYLKNGILYSDVNTTSTKKAMPQTLNQELAGLRNSSGWDQSYLNTHTSSSTRTEEMKRKHWDYEKQQNMKVNDMLDVSLIKINCA